MILIIGGAYQGKLEFAKNEFNLIENDIFKCTYEILHIDFNKKCISNIEKFIFAMIKAKNNPLIYIQNNIENFKNKIIICEDISCGVVPLEYDNRLFRDTTGHIMSIFSKNSDKVFRLFCGIATQIK